MTKIWTVEPEQIWRRTRAPGISGFMRLKNEAEFLDRAIDTHIAGLDELTIVYNDCSDETPEICLRWRARYPDKINVVEYEPKIVPIGTPESLSIDPMSPHCIANYYNFALSLTNRTIAIKIDGDHHAVTSRFNRICDRVRKELPANRHYPIYGLNLTVHQGEIVIYNYYEFCPDFSADGLARRGPPPFTSGDQGFYYVDKTSWHTVHPVEGYEMIPLKARFERAALTYCFFHLKGMKVDRGTGSWEVQRAGNHRRSAWTNNVLSPDPADLSTIEAMRRHNPAYFRGADVYRELRQVFPYLPIRAPAGERLPPISIREHLADLWYRLAYP